MDVARSAPQGAHYHADIIYLLLGNKEGSKCLMVLRVKPTPTRFPINSLYTPIDTRLHFISSVCPPVGPLLLSFAIIKIGNAMAVVVTPARQPTQFLFETIKKSKNAD